MHLGLGGGLGGEAAVGAADDALASDDVGVADESLGDEFGVFDEVSGVGDDAGDEDLVVGEVDIFPDLPFVFVPGVGAFEGVG